MSSSFDSFKSSLTGEVVRPGEDGYDWGISRWSDSVVRPAQYVVFPKTNDDVASAIIFGKESNLEIALCGGGHSWSGASSTTGLLIHLGKHFNQVRCDPDAKLFYIGGGALWEAVDREGYKHGLATVAGTVSHTGVGGLVLGGGYGWLTGRHGLALDNVVQLTVVLASGETVTASQTSHPDLFWGCRGAGCNFGVVTEFAMKAHPQRPTVFVTRLFFPLDKLEIVVNSVEKWFETSGQDECASWGCYRFPPERKPILMITYVFNGTPEEGRKNARVLYDAGPVKEVASPELPCVELNTIQNAGLAHGGRKYCKGTTIPKVTYEIANSIISSLTTSIASEPRFANSGTMFEYHNKTAVLSHPPQSTAYANRSLGRENLSWIFYDDPALDSAARDAIRSLSKTDDGYTNYNPNPERGAEKVFGENYVRLREVKRMYDPERVFGKWFPIEPAARNVLGE